jgi:hypothetical protein
VGFFYIMRENLSENTLPQHYGTVNLYLTKNRLVLPGGVSNPTNPTSGMGNGKLIPILRCTPPHLRCTRHRINRAFVVGWTFMPRRPGCSFE